MMSSQLKHCRSALGGMRLVSLFPFGIARKRLHRSVTWKTSLPSAHVGGISGVQSLWSGKDKLGCISFTLSSRAVERERASTRTDVSS